MDRVRLPRSGNLLVRKHERTHHLIRPVDDLAVGAVGDAIPIPIFVRAAAVSDGSGLIGTRVFVVRYLIAVTVAFLPCER